MSSNPVLTGKQCPYCGAASELIDSAEVYNGKSYGPIWICRPCGAYVGVHKGTTVALGRLADRGLREMKKAFHAKFDPIWRSGVMSRSGLYEWLAARIGVDIKECHGGMFNESQCSYAILQLDQWASSIGKMTDKELEIVASRAHALIDTFSDKSGSGSVITSCQKNTCTWPACLCVTTSETQQPQQ